MLYHLLISLPMMVCFFWSIFFLVRWFQQSVEPKIKGTILLFFVVSTVLYTNHWLYFTDSASTFGLFTYLLANLSVYPIYYAYLRALTRAKMNWEIPVLMVPALLVAILFPLNSHHDWFDDDILLISARMGFAIQVAWVWYRGFQLLRATRLRMDNTYSDNRSYLLQPTYVLQHLLGIIAFISTVLNIIGREFFAHEAPVTVPAIIMSVLLFSLGFIAAHTEVPQETVTQEEESHEEDKATTEETDALFFKISTAIREQKLFADQRLTIQDLATAINSNRTYVSNCINRRTGLSFSQYIAHYRVEYAQQILRDPKYKTDHDAITDAIALSGFSSDQNFYRVFKEVTGVTPLQFRKTKN